MRCSSLLRKHFEPTNRFSRAVTSALLYPCSSRAGEPHLQGHADEKEELTKYAQRKTLTSLRCDFFDTRQRKNRGQC